MQIANLTLHSPALLAPMAGYTDHPFRLICKEQGAGIVYTEFVSSEGLIRDSQKTKDYLYFKESERPIGIQIFGHNPESMAQSAQMIEEEFQPDLIDMNFGCSVRKVVKKGAGAALLRDVHLIGAIATRVVKSVRTPVTAKIRSGWTQKEIVAVEVAQRLADAGISAITVHPRTAAMSYSDPARWELIREVKESVAVPIIGNGDIKTADDAMRMLRETGCDAVMVGRGAIGNPWIFDQINRLYLGNPEIVRNSSIDKLDMCLRQLQMEIEIRGEAATNRIMKKFYRWYFRGFPNVSEVRKNLLTFSSINETLGYLSALRNDIRSYEEMF